MNRFSVETSNFYDLAIGFRVVLLNCMRTAINLPAIVHAKYYYLVHSNNISAGEVCMGRNTIVRFARGAVLDATE